jgi:large subunit ribosomal protein L1
MSDKKNNLQQRKRGKKYLAVVDKVEDRKYKLDEAVELVKNIAKETAKFDQTVEVAMRLGVDPKYSDQMVRGYTVLPHGTGKQVRVVVIAAGEKVKEAEAAGADFVGEDDLIQKISDGWLEFDAIVATPDVMRKVGKLGKLLGARGLMPSPKSGTVTFEVENAVKEIKAGKVQFKVDKAGNLHAGIGKASFSTNHLVENFTAFLEAVQKAKPIGAKGKYIQRVYLAATMTPSVEVDLLSIE